jgi:protein-tyrosine phosphatase
MSTSELTWVDTGTPGRLAIIPAPSGGHRLRNAVLELRAAGVDLLVSLLPEEQAQRLELAAEASTCQSAGLRFLQFSIIDHSVPPYTPTTLAFLESLKGEVAGGASVAIHCWAGIGRSALVAASVLCLLEVEAEEAMRRLSEARGFPVPETAEQRQWVLALAQRRALQ